MLHDFPLQQGVIRKGAIYVVALVFSVICVSIGLVGGTSIGGGPNIAIPNSSQNAPSPSQGNVPSPLNASGTFCPVGSVKTPSCQCPQSSFEEVFCKDTTAVCTANGGTTPIAPPGSTDTSYCMYSSSSSVYQQKLNDSSCIVACVQ